MSEYWRDVKAEGQENRARNRESSPTVLTRHGIAYETKNDGTHLIVTHAGKTVDFWPGTGLWRARKGTNGRGVFRLLAFLDNGRSEP